MKLLFVTKQRSNQYGVSVGLINSANFVANALNQDLGVETKSISVVDGNGIDKEVYNYKPTHVFLEALWATPAKVEELSKKYPYIKWYIRLHSRTSFLALEGIAFEWLNAHVESMKTRSNIFLIGNHKGFVEDMINIGYPFGYLPNIYKPLVQRPTRPAKDDSVINLSCFGALRPFKNHVQQAVAAIIFANETGKKLRFHINSTRSEQRGENVLKNLRALFSGGHHELVEWPWMDHDKFLEAVATIDIGMQVSFSESYNLVVADHIWNLVPVVVSDEINWVPQKYQCRPTDTKQIVQTLKYAWLNQDFAYENLISLFLYNIESLKVWAEFLFGAPPLFNDSKINLEG